MAVTAVFGEGAHADQPATVTWSTAGLPPAYLAQTFAAEVPAALRAEFDRVLSAAGFFALPEDLGLAEAARDAGSYQITVDVGGRRHSVSFSDTSVTPGLAALRNWLRDKLMPTARRVP
jgi:hypothetical protein